MSVSPTAHVQPLAAALPMSARFDHDRCARKLAENARAAAETIEDRRRGRSRGKARHPVPAAELSRIDAIVAARWASAPSVEAIAVEVGHSAPFVSRRARALGLSPRRPDRRRP